MSYPDRTRQELSAALETLTIESAAAFRFAGHRVVVAPAPPAGYGTHPLPGIPLVRELQSVFYASCYCRQFGSAAPMPERQDSLADPEFVQTLAGIHRDLSTWDRGWTIYAVGPDGRVYVQKGERQRIAMPGEFATCAPPGLPLRNGALVMLWVQRDSATLQPGFFHFFSAVPTDAWDDFELFRIYFHTTAQRVPELIRSLSAAMSRYQVPYLMKTLAHPAAYSRADATVLYVARRYHHIALAIAANISDRHRRDLRAWAPLFTGSLAPGVGFADDPGGNESFGMQRCRLVAEGVYAAAVLGRQDLAARMSAIEGAFARNGLLLERPHLGAGKSDIPIPIMTGAARA